MSHTGAMSILRRAEGYCLNQALCAKSVEWEWRNWLEAADLLNLLWRGMWKGPNVAQDEAQAL